jgi:hypothetical protein
VEDSGLVEQVTKRKLKDISFASSSSKKVQTSITDAASVKVEDSGLVEQVTKRKLKDISLASHVKSSNQLTNILGSKESLCEVKTEHTFPNMNKFLQDQRIFNAILEVPSPAKLSVVKDNIFFNDIFCFLEKKGE